MQIKAIEDQIREPPDKVKIIRLETEKKRLADAP
jgi:hypothetical protein